MLSNRRHALDCRSVCKETGEVSFHRVVRHPFHREAYGTKFCGESKTHASHAESCDINRIVASYMRTGNLPPSKGQGAYADVTGLQGDLTTRINESRETIAKAEENGRKIDAARKESAKAEAAAKPSAKANDAASDAVAPAAAAAPKP